MRLWGFLQASGKLSVPSASNSLKTRDLQLAEVRKWAVVAEFKAQIENARRGDSSKSLMEEAMEFRRDLQRLKGTRDEEGVLWGIDVRADEIRGLPLAEHPGPAGDYEYAPTRAEQAGKFYRIAVG